MLNNGARHHSSLSERGEDIQRHSCGIRLPATSPYPAQTFGPNVATVLTFHLTAPSHTRRIKELSSFRRSLPMGLWLETAMQEGEKYREYAAECRRLAEKASNADKQALLKIAEAWDQQAKFAEARTKKAGA